MSNGQTFNPREHLINIKTNKGFQEYLEVKWRLVWFRQECPNGTIETEIVHLDLDKDVEAEVFQWNAEKRRSDKVIKKANGVAIFKATVHDGKGGSATGTKSENAANFPDFIEKAESGSIGRALAALGYGTQFANDLDEGQRIVDAPVDRGHNNSANGNSYANERTNGASGTSSEPDPNAKATEQQISSIKKLYQHLEKPEPDDLSSLTFTQAKQSLQQLSEKYRATKRQPQGAKR